jgi:hypothetical protein
MLKMPEGQRKIDYHLMTSDHIVASCGGRDVSACELGDTLQIATNVLPFQHELIHAYMQLAAPDADPVPFVVEGTAQAIGCYGLPVGISLTKDIPPWQQAVTSDEYAYGQGGLFVRYLIRTQGIDAFVRYYAQAPGRRDPALFAANFSAFWNMSMDNAWTAMHTVGPGAASVNAPICPCSLPMPATDGQPLNNDWATQPYWPLPDTGSSSFALTAPSGFSFMFADCEGIAPIFESTWSLYQLGAGAARLGDVAVAIVQPPSDGRSRYTITPISTASVGPYIADSCGGGVPYQLPADFVTGWGNLSIMVDQTSIGAVAKYVQVQLPGTGPVDLGLGAGVDVCDSCGFDQGTCVATPLSNGPPFASSIVPPGPVNVRWSVPPVSAGADFPDPAGGSFQVTGMQSQ